GALAGRAKFGHPCHWAISSIPMASLKQSAKASAPPTIVALRPPSRPGLAGDATGARRKSARTLLRRRPVRHRLFLETAAHPAPRFQFIPIASVGQMQPDHDNRSGALRWRPSSNQATRDGRKHRPTFETISGDAHAPRPRPNFTRRSTRSESSSAPPHSGSTLAKEILGGGRAALAESRLVLW